MVFLIRLRLLKISVKYDIPVLEDSAEVVVTKDKSVALWDIEFYL
jgi:hypothetical protein